MFFFGHSRVLVKRRRSHSLSLLPLWSSLHPQKRDFKRILPWFVPSSKVCPHVGWCEHCWEATLETWHFNCHIPILSCLPNFNSPYLQSCRTLFWLAASFLKYITATFQINNGKKQEKWSPWDNAHIRLLCRNHWAKTEARRHRQLSRPVTSA